MSYKPQALGFFVATECVWPLQFELYQPISLMFPLPPYGLVEPARQAYSHWASVGRRNAFPSFSLSFWQNSIASFHEICSTGFFSPLKRLESVSYTHLRAHETGRNLVCRL